MKKLCIILLAGFIYAACTEEKVGVYTLEDSYVYFPYIENSKVTAFNVAIDSSYFFRTRSPLTISSTRKRDTFYYRVYASGWKMNVDRKIKIEQWSYKLSGREEAVAGVNYVAFNDPEMEKHLIMPADSMAVSIPIIVQYDPSIAGKPKAFSLVFKLVESEDFKVMELNKNLLNGNSARQAAIVDFNQSSL